MLFLFVVCALASLPSLVENAGSQKKGLSAAATRLMCDDFKVLSNISWWYDWGKDFEQFRHACPNSNSHVPQFVLMFWSMHSNKSIHIPSDSQFLLGLNEPDHTHQAHMTPQEAAKYWPMVEKAAAGIPLVAPVPAGHDFHWLDQFFAACHGCRIDYVAAHTYNCRAEEVIGYLKSLYNRYHKKVWLTEFACAHTGDMNVQLNFIKSVLPQLEAADFVYRYSWFAGRIRHYNPTGFVRQSASLLHSDSSTLTTLGQFYNNFHDGHGTSVVG
ncbi:uncharacterized protein LOC127833397 isoform X1 [Dreissena polymorpha]|uniref:uncharacterized protein LOC127833397 isoform X1 n=1 Tax=Dreissena polymorpha TaxID=45954 RepID=UPI0022648658|nr:uncharacterized protein LOC127833397 isoform X1 [Dreissena polymorpha]